MATLNAERLWTIPRVGAPHALADGRLMVPVTTHDDEGPTTTVWRLDPGSGTLEQFARGSVSGLAVTDDAVAYLRKIDGQAQVHVQPLAGGEGRMVATLPLGADGVRWTPDGRLVALARLWSDHPTLGGTADHEDDPGVRATENALYRYWDAWVDHILHPVLIDPATGSVTDLTPGSTRFWLWPATDSPIDDLDVSPDGSLVSFCADDSPPPHRRLSWSLFVVNVDGSGLRRLDTGRDGHSHRPRFTYDGSGIVYGYQSEPDFYASPTELTRYDLGSEEDVTLAVGWDRSPEGWVFDGEGRLLFTAEDEGRSVLWRLSSVDGSPERLTGGGWATNPTVSPGGIVHSLAHDLATPPEVHRMGPVGADGLHVLEPASRFTVSALAEVEMGRVAEHHIPGADGDPIQVLTVDPPGVAPDERLPLVHMIHGGPHGVFGHAWHWRWNAQVVAAGGYRVAMVNFHGSTGWGDGFTRSIHGGWGDRPYRDVEAATDRLIGLGLADETKMAVTGGSYGGYLTAWIISQTNRYVCAIAHAAVTNLGGMYASDVTDGRALSYGAEIWEDRAAVERWSPASHAAGYDTPTLVLHGHRDARVPVTQGLELYGVLMAKGVPARLVSFADENHWILDRDNSVRWYDEYLGWLRRWLT